MTAIDEDKTLRETASAISTPDYPNDTAVCWRGANGMVYGTVEDGAECRLVRLRSGKTFRLRDVPTALAADSNHP